ncbi:FKBP-type peptidyl-prolyl cis-trans isomerase [Novosphingobium sp.]|uniref:FKBP-type peptidyl-prolyl cis-trans isomerase n=1 Tax=Novosphingobium sp. TaxID=1874826 RepID=UPI0025CBC627|nr:FKBP-type peptidyl-prolyl cis-trans isomerase [Novosphingobium sp.]
MTEITRVPLQPIAKGALGKLWLGVAAAALAAGGLAWATLPAGVKVDVVKEGTGPNPTRDQVVWIKYTGKLADGKEFDKSPERNFPIPGVLPEGVPNVVSGFVPGFTEGLLKMKEGGSYVLHIPADKGYGATPPEGSPIPPNADLTFDVELIDIMSREEAEGKIAAAQQIMQQMQAKQGGGKGAPQGAPQGMPQPQ